jgi:hypothetical protein
LFCESYGTSGSREGNIKKITASFRKSSHIFPHFALKTSEREVKSPSVVFLSTYILNTKFWINNKQLDSIDNLHSEEYFSNL